MSISMVMVTELDQGSGFVQVIDKQKLSGTNDVQSPVPGLDPLSSALPIFH